MGSTTFCESAADAELMQSGSITAGARTPRPGAALAIKNAAARPPMMAKWNGRVSGCLKAVVANVVFLLEDCLNRHCERSEAIHSAASGKMDCFRLRAGALRRT